MTRSPSLGASKALGIGVGENIDGIAMTPVGREKLIEAVHALGRKLGQFAAAGHQRVGGQDGGTAGVGQNGKPWTSGTRLPAEHFRHIEEIGDIVNAQNS
jgi:hypothetical protein